MRTTAAAGSSVSSASVPAPIAGHTGPASLSAYGSPNAWSSPCGHNCASPRRQWTHDRHGTFHVNTT